MHSAVTLIELLVVIAIMALLSSLAIISFERSDEDVVVSAGRNLAAAADRARQLAQRTGIPHFLIMNIQNAGNGKVMRNFHEDDPKDFPGRHWYAIIGPAMDRDEGNRTPPHPYTANGDNYTYLWYLEYVAAVKEAQVGKTGYLPRGVRFLALSDQDLADSGKRKERMWHGQYNKTEGRIYAWGGYDPEISNYPGFQFRGKDESEPIYDKDQHCMVYGAEVYGQIHKDSTARQKKDVGKSLQNGNLKKAVAPETKRTGPDTTVFPGTPKHLVDAYLLDWCLEFDEDGKGHWVGGIGRDVYFEGSRRADMMSTGTWEHGGWIVTLARDIDPDERWVGGQLYDHDHPDPQTEEAYYERFPSAEAAKESLRPWCRVFIPRSGGSAQVLPMDHPMSHIDDGEFIE